MSKKLWEHQADAVNAVYELWETVPHVVIEIPTGAGKSLVQAHIIRELFHTVAGSRVVGFAPTRELVEQNYHELLEYWPGAPAGIVCAGLGRQELHKKIIFATPQTFINRLPHMGGDPVTVVFADEAHRVTDKKAKDEKKSVGVYRACLEDLAARNANLKTLGLTATPFRHMKGLIYGGPESFFKKCAYSAEVAELIKKNILSPLTVIPTMFKIDTEIKKKDAYGDYNVEELAKKAMLVSDLAVREVIACAADRKKWLVFCCNVEHAKGVAAQFVNAGVPSAVLYTPTKDDSAEEKSEMKAARVQAVADFRAGKIKCLVNVNILTTGFNVPDIDTLVMLRPTKSPVLYVQAAGRGMRIAPGKENCLYLDFAGNIDYHGPVDDLELRTKTGDGSGDAPKKRCPECKTLVHASVRICTGTREVDYERIVCGYEFPPPEPEEKINDKASMSRVLSVAGRGGTLPDGDYGAVVVAGCEQVSKKGNRYLKFEIKITNDEYSGYTIYDYLNLWHPNPKAKKYAQITLSKMVKALNKNKYPKTTAELLNKPCRVRIATQEGTDGYRPRNVIRDYYSAEKELEND